MRRVSEAAAWRFSLRVAITFNIFAIFTPLRRNMFLMRSRCCCAIWCFDLRHLRCILISCMLITWCGAGIISFAAWFPMRLSGLSLYHDDLRQLFGISAQGRVRRLFLSWKWPKKPAGYRDWPAKAGRPAHEYADGARLPAAIRRARSSFHACAALDAGYAFI